MNGTFISESFSIAGAAVHIAPGGRAVLLQRDAVEDLTRRLPEGYLLGLFVLSTVEDLHAAWEMHAGGDEILVSLGGDLDVEYSDGSRYGAAPLREGHGLVVPRGMWHRLALCKPGLLLSLSPLAGTQLSHHLRDDHEQCSDE